MLKKYEISRIKTHEEIRRIKPKEETRIIKLKEEIRIPLSIKPKEKIISIILKEEIQIIPRSIKSKEKIRSIKPKEEIRSILKVLLKKIRRLTLTKIERIGPSIWNPFRWLPVLMFNVNVNFIKENNLIFKRQTYINKIHSNSLFMANNNSKQIISSSKIFPS